MTNVPRSAPMPGPTNPYMRTHKRTTPLTPGEVQAARAAEAERKRWDPFYITAAEARTVPSEVLAQDPVLQARIRQSQQDWPENRMSATEALGKLPGGCGEVVEDRSVPAESLFQPKRGAAPEEG